jgi:hypothetical protein
MVQPCCPSGACSSNGIRETFGCPARTYWEQVFVDAFAGPGMSAVRSRHADDKPAHASGMDLSSFSSAHGPTVLSFGRLLIQRHPGDVRLSCQGTRTSARPMSPEWVREVRDQCRRAGVAFFFKQWGGYRPKARWVRSTVRWTGSGCSLERPEGVSPGTACSRPLRTL